MLVDPFELLTNARETVAANVAAIRAKRDFFIADIDFQGALIGGGSEPASETTVASAAPAAGGGH